MSPSSNPLLELQEVVSDDLPEVATIFPRSFHPISSYMRKAFPDTPTMRRWWTDISQTAFDDPNTHLMKVIDRKNNDVIVALGRWRFSREDEPIHGGAFSSIPLTEDHDRERFAAMIDFQVEQRQSLMSRRPHVLIELLVTVHEYKGFGAGKLLVQRMCSDANDAGIECFVETNKNVVPFYEKLGFIEKKHAIMPGDDGFEEHVLTKPAKTFPAPGI
jgi:GNAT superfamily N-acetyltransferase